MVLTRSASSTLIRWLAPQVSPFQPVRVTMPWMPISGSNGPGLKSEPAAAAIPASAKERYAMQRFISRFAVEVELVGIVIGVGGERRGHGADRLDAPHQIVVDQRAVGDLGARVGSREQLLRPLDRGQHHIDGDVAIGMAIDLDAGAMHPLDPGVEIVLRLGDVAVVRRLDAGIGLAERHGALGERAVAGVLGRGAEPDPLVAEAGRDAVA